MPLFSIGWCIGSFVVCFCIDGPYVLITLYSILVIFYCFFVHGR
jgi:hypothetical protein